VSFALSDLLLRQNAISQRTTRVWATGSIDEKIPQILIFFFFFFLKNLPSLVFFGNSILMAATDVSVVLRRGGPSAKRAVGAIFLKIRP
jgi:hypothetical protein